MAERKAKRVDLDPGATGWARVLGGPPETATMRSGYVTLAPGRSVGLHDTGGYEEALVVLAGTGELRTAGEAPLPLRAYTVAWCPPATAHDVANTGSEPLRYVYLVARARPPETPDPQEDPVLTALRFHACIGRADLAGIEALLTEDHLFTDREGAVVRGRPAMLDAWRAFFARFPGYRNVVARAEARGGEVVALAGHAVWIPGGPPDLALWTARVADGRIAEWRVWHDTPANRSALGL